jgi:CRP-like cAMP-binding protein
MSAAAEGASAARGGAQAALARIPLFEGLHEEFLGRLAEIAVAVTHPAGTPLWKRGEAASGLFVLVDGGVRIDGDGELSCEISAGDSFAEDALCDEAARRTSALCDASAQLWHVSREDFQDLLFVDRDLAYDLLWRFARGFSARDREEPEQRALLVLAGRL